MTIRVNGDLVPDEAVEFELGRLIKFYADHMPEDKVRAQLDTLKLKARDQAIGAKLLIDEAMRLDIRVDDLEVEDTIARMAAQAGGAERLEAMLKSQKISRTAFMENVRRGRRVDRLVSLITEGISDPTEEEIRAHFEAHQQEYQTAGQAQAMHILVKPEGEDAGAVAAAKAKLEGIRQRVLDGASFAEEAAAHSECPSGKQAGGSLGWFSPGMMVKEFDDAVFSMNVDELSEIIQTPFGFHIILKTAEEPGGDATFDDAHDKIRDFLRHAARGEAVAARVDDLKAKATIEISE